MLVGAGFSDIKIQVKENAADIIKGWMPGSGAEKYVTSAYITAVKPASQWGLRDNVRADVSLADAAALVEVSPSGGGAAACGPGA
mmetsp:Transcript_106408/g.296092  ORF Transcript_106408/g.296092 Transcript_106408/m.296092 type:complete len:85 (+) Transcript_106408:1056-1310(+)